MFRSLTPAARYMELESSIRGEVNANLLSAPALEFWSKVEKQYDSIIRRLAYDVDRFRGNANGTMTVLWQGYPVQGTDPNVPDFVELFYGEIQDPELP